MLGLLLFQPRVLICPLICDILLHARLNEAGMELLFVVAAGV